MTGLTDVYRCKICRDDAGRIVVSTERMFGMGGEFHYFECARCGCVQLTDVPKDLAPYYPADRYYSFSGNQRPPALPVRSGLKGWVFRARNRHALFGRPWYGGVIGRFRPAEDSTAIRPFLSRVRSKSFQCRILDVGSGRGLLLREFAKFGFTDLHGVDPFLTDVTSPAAGITLHGCDVSELDAGKFDLIILHHSLEHVPDPVRVLSAVRDRLSAGAVCRVEVPVAGSLAWQEYGAEWAELDPPRHLFLHTRRSMTLAATEADLELIGTESAGTPFEFWASELYRRGMTYFDPSRGRMRVMGDEFTAAEAAAFESKSAAANADGTCGRLAFWFRAAGSGV